MIPTKGDPGKTVATFFINNGRRYLAFGQFFYSRVPNEDYFNVMKGRLQDADWPVQEIGEQDCRIYGLELIDLSYIIGDKPTSLVNQTQYTISNMIEFIDLNVDNLAAAFNSFVTNISGQVADLAAKVDTDAGGLSAQITALAVQVTALGAKIDALPKTTNGGGCCCHPVTPTP